MDGLTPAGPRPARASVILVRTLPRRLPRRQPPFMAEDIDNLLPPLPQQEIPKVSPSSVHLWDLCERRWWAKYVEGHREPTTKSQAFGTAVHKVLEEYDTKGTLIDVTTPEGLVANAALPYIEEPGSGVCEESFTLEYRPGWAFFGKADWVHPGGLKVRDYKTTSDFKWIKPEEALRTDPQALIYGLVALVTQEAEAPLEPRLPVTMQWLYLRTKGKPKPRNVEFQLTPEEITAGIANLTRKIEDQILPAKKVKFLDLAPNTDSCFAYHKPCPHRHRCTDLGVKGLSSIFRKDTMIAGKDDLMAELRAKAVGNATTPKSESKPQATTQGLDLEALSPTKSSAPDLGGLDDLFGDSGPVLDKLEESAEAQGGLTDVATDLGDEPAEEESEEQEETPPEGVSNVIGVSGEVIGQTVPEGKRGKGRPKGSKNKPKEPPQGLPAPTPQVDKVPANLPEVKAPQPQPTPPSREVEVNGLALIETLYVNCLPMDLSRVVMASYIFSKAQQAITEELGLPHYSLADFGKGRGAFCIAVEKTLASFAAQGPINLYVDARAPEGKDCLETLIRYSLQVIRGI